MFKSLAFCRCLQTLTNNRLKHLNHSIRRQLSSSDNKSSNDSISDQILSEMKDSNSDEFVAKDKTLSFAKAFEKFERLTKEAKTDRKDTSSELSEPFPTLLRYSTFIQMGDPEGKVVVGRIEDIVGDDLYIDIGCKFNGVCKRPKTNPSDYIRGAKVKVRINDLELSDRFLGSSKDMTLLEADITLMGLLWSPNRNADKLVFTEVDNI